MTGLTVEFVGADDAYTSGSLRYAQLLNQIGQHLIRKNADILVIDATAASPFQLNDVFNAATQPGVVWSVGTVQILEPNGGIYR